MYPPNSASGPNGVPSILLKNCAKELCCPIRIIWEESIECGTVPKFYKETHITPIFKKGDRARAANYRPIDLTSHIIKAYERVLRGVMVDFIDKNQLLCNNQHEFRLGRSCLAQLLSHVDDIVQGSVRHAIYLDVKYHACDCALRKVLEMLTHVLFMQKVLFLGYFTFRLC